MNILVILVGSIALFALGFSFYARRVGRAFGVNPDRPTPACTINDGKDYVPTRVHVLFAHHFSAVAGAGPILGPTVALLYGAVPAWIWLVLGGVFLGAVHDFAALFASVREGGRSVAEIARRALGDRAFKLYISFLLVLIVLVTSAFLIASARSLTSAWPVDKLNLPPGQTLLKTVTQTRTVTVNGATIQQTLTLGRIGGIASTSVLVITLFAPVLGWLLYRKQLAVSLAYPLASFICLASIVLGIWFPINLSATSWMVILSLYCFAAAGIPVWLVLQPRDFINVQILYAGIILLVVSLFRAGLGGLSLQAPAFNVSEGVANLGFLWPMMFVTIACGAISGFHGVVASGTSSKQLSNERQARTVGYLGMLGESTLGLCVTLALAAGLSFADYRTIVWPELRIESNPVLAFSLAAGHIFERGLGIPLALGAVFGILLVEGFVITTLDVAVRLNRYLLEELWAILFTTPPAFLRSNLFNAGLAVFGMWFVAYTNAFTAVWPVFGAANQLLAALSLIAITVWFLRRGQWMWYTLVPAVLVGTTTIASLVLLLPHYWKTRSLLLLCADLALLVLSLGVVREAINTGLALQVRRPAPAPHPIA